MCTAIQVTYEGGSVLGRTMDLETPLEYNALFLPRGYAYASTLEGEPLTMGYASLGMCFNNQDPIKDGFNEHGLTGITNDYRPFNIYLKEPEKGYTNLSSLWFLNYCLSEYRNLEELKDGLKGLRIALKDSNGQDAVSLPFHWMFTDPSGDLLVIEPKDGKLCVYDNPYRVMTNAPHIESHAKKLERFLEGRELPSINTAKKLPSGYDPTSRFIRAFMALHKGPWIKTKEEALSKLYEALHPVRIPENLLESETFRADTFTQYVSACDPRDLVLYVQTDKDHNIYHLKLNDLLEEKERKAFFIKRSFKSFPL